MTVWRRVRLGGGLGRDAFLAMAIRALGLGLGFASHVLLSRLLGAEAYGRYAIVLGFALIFVIPTRWGLDTSAYKLAAHYREQGEERRLAAFQRFSIGVMAVGTLMWASVGIFVAFVSAAYADTPVRWIEVMAFAALIFPLAVIGYCSVVLRTSGRIAASQVYEQIARPLLLSAGVVLFAWQTGGLTLQQALLATVVSLWAVLLALLAHTHRAQPMTGGAIGIDDRKRWLRTGGTLLAISATQELINQVDVILLGWAGQPHSAALFSAASRLAALVAFGLVAVGMVAAYPIALAYQKGDRAAIAAIARQSAWLATLFGVVVAVIINVGAPTLLGLFGPEFGKATTALAILTSAYLVNAITGVVAYLLIMTGHEKLFLKILVLSLVCNVLLNLLLVPAWGAVGAAVAASVGLSLLNILTAIGAKNRVGIDGTIFARRAS